MPHCYVVNPVTGKEEMEMCQCPLGLMPHCYDRGAVIARVEAETVSMPSRAVTSFLPWDRVTAERSKQHRVNALLGCYLISTYTGVQQGDARTPCGVNALSGCYLISTEYSQRWSRILRSVCQCPLGLLPHFYGAVCKMECTQVDLACQCPLGLLPHFYVHYASWEFFQMKCRCQCPLGLLPHFYFGWVWRSSSWRRVVSMPSRAVTSFLLTPNGEECVVVRLRVNALSGCYLISTVPLQKPRFYAVSRAYFCRYLSEYSDSNSFSCMLTIWTYLMR